MILTIFLAAIIGGTLGLLGGGGSILAVPELAYGAGLSPKTAIATSLLVVGTTSVFALVPYARRELVAWRVGVIFAATAMVGAYAGGLAADWFEGRTLLLLFAAMMVLTALAMLKRRPARDVVKRDRLPWALVALEGIGVGGATGLVGAGGGFLVVPALVLLGGMPINRAVGTSLMVIALKSFAAAGGHLSHVTIDFNLTVLVTLAAVLGSFGGVLVSKLLSPEHLKEGFGILVATMACYVVARETSYECGLAMFVAVSALIVFLTRGDTPTEPNPA